MLRENAGLGTEATRAEILETLFTRKYIEKQGKHIRATQLGGGADSGIAGGADQSGNNGAVGTGSG
ncbi:DNA topoisomerase [Escherichia coli]